MEKKNISQQTMAVMQFLLVGNLICRWRWGKPVFLSLILWTGKAWQTNDKLLKRHLQLADHILQKQIKSFARNKYSPEVRDKIKGQFHVCMHQNS